MDFGTTVVNLYILVNQDAGKYPGIAIDLPKSSMFTINAMSRNKELACHWERKRTRLLSSSTMSLMITKFIEEQPKMSKRFVEEVRVSTFLYCIVKESWIEFRHNITKKMALTKPEDEDLNKLSTKCRNAIYES